MQGKGTEINNLSVSCRASLHLDLNKQGVEHKASPTTALLPPPEAAKADPSPHPAPQGAAPGSGSAGLSAGSCSRLRTLQQLTANPRGRGFSASNSRMDTAAPPP